MSDVDKIQIQDGTILNIKDTTARNNINNLSSSINDLDKKISSVASGSPAGAFTTLDDLKNSQTADKTKIYVVQENGGWYFWNGTEWTLGGTYQATEIADNTINNFQTQFLKQGKNKLLGLYTKGKGITVEPLDNGNIKLVGTADGSVSNFPISKFTIDKEDDYLFTCSIIAGQKQGMYIYNVQDTSTIVATIATGTLKQTIHLIPGIYTLNSYFKIGTSVNLEMFIQLVSKSEQDENVFSSLNYKPSIINKFTNEIPREKYCLNMPLSMPIIADKNYSIGTIDLIKGTLKLNSNIFMVSRNIHSTFNENPTLSYWNLNSLNSNLTEEFNLVEDKSKAGIYVCFLDYKCNIGVSHYSAFLNDYNNYNILFLFYWSNSQQKITSYNTFLNNFDIIGSVNPSGDFNTLTYNAIGDSLTYGYVTSTTRLSIPYPLAVENQLNLQTSYNNGLTGTTIADDRTVMQSYYPMSADERMATYQNANIISVMGGTNDYSKNVTLGDINTNDATTFYGGYKKLLNYLITNNPSSFIFTITPPWSQSAPTTTNEKGVSKQDITNAIKEISSYFGVACLDMNSLGQLGYINRNTWTSDGTHFNQNYVSNVFAPKLANFIYNNLQKLPN